mgnify:CR=1 FL=1
MLKRFCTLLALIILLALPLGASAENYCWKDPQFNFAGVNKIQLFDVDVSEGHNARNFYPDPSAARTMEQLIQIAMTDKGITLIMPQTEQDVIKVDPNETSIRPDMLNADLNIFAYGYTKTYVPSRVEEYTSYEKITHIDKDGRKSETTIPVTRTRVIPAYDHYVTYVDLEIKMYDPATNKVVFTYRDSRNRSYESNPTSMARRIAESIVKELLKAKKV